jgi:hypothetical protein
VTRRLAGLLLLGLALLAAGCGGDDEPASPAPLPGGGAGTSTGGDDLARTGAERGRPERDAGGDGGSAGAERSRGDEQGRGSARGDDEGSRPRGGSSGDGGEEGRRRGDSEPVSPNDPRVRDDVAAIKAAVRRFFDGLRTRDGAICGEVMTQHYMEVLTGRRGEAAVRACRERVERGGVDSEVTAFGEVRVDRDVATAELNLRSRRGTTSERVSLARDRGRWKIDAP